MSASRLSFSKAKTARRSKLPDGFSIAGRTAATGMFLHGEGAELTNHKSESSDGRRNSSNGGRGCQPDKHGLIDRFEEVFDEIEVHLIPGDMVVVLGGNRRQESLQ